MSTVVPAVLPAVLPTGVTTGVTAVATAVLPAVLSGGAAAGAARLAYAALRRLPPGGEATWTRVNHRGEPVTLLEGPAVTAGALVGPLAAIVLSKTMAPSKTINTLYPERPVPSATASALVIAGAGAAAFGVADDLAGSGKRRGLRGHLGALARGEVTTGAVKLLGIGATGLVAALLLEGRLPDDGLLEGRCSAAGAADVVVNAGLIAGGANLLNLFDLRPGRAIKVATVAGAFTVAAAAAGGESRGGAFGVNCALGSALGLLPEDLGERAMLGDCGANALGALLGTAAAAALPRPARIAALTGIIALTAASEKISFTKVIARTPTLRWLDMLGRRPPAVPAPK